MTARTWRRFRPASVVHALSGFSPPEAEPVKNSIDAGRHVGTRPSVKKAIAGALHDIRAPALAITRCRMIGTVGHDDLVERVAVDALRHET